MLIADVVSDGFDFAFKVSDDQHFRALFRRLGIHQIRETGRPHSGYWVMPLNTIMDIVELDGRELPLLEHLVNQASLSGYEDRVDTLQSLFDRAKEKATPGLLNEGVTVHLYRMSYGRGTVLRSEFNSMTRHVAKTMNASWNAGSKVWKFDNISPESVHFNLEMEGFFKASQIVIAPGEFDLVERGSGSSVGSVNLGECLKPVAAQKTKDQDPDSRVMMSLAEEIRFSPFCDEEILSECRSRGCSDYQEDGVLHMARKTSAACFDDMGVGKTRQAIVAGHIVSRHRQILVGCPASVLFNWEREINMVYPEEKVSLCEYKEDARWIVINYDLMHRMVPHASKFEVLLLDEAHLLKEPGTARTQAAFSLSGAIPYRYILTGTPILNREGEIHTLLRLTGHPLGELSQADFVDQFAGGSAVRFQLNAKIKEWMIRRRKELVLKDYKGKQLQPYFVTPAQPMLSRYYQILRDSTLTGLQKMSRLRPHIEHMKIGAAMEFAASLLPDDKVIFFCEYQDSVEALANRLRDGGRKVVTLIGSDSKKARQAAIDQFQCDADTSIFITTTAAGGVGITLTAANYVYFLGLPWTNALKEQAEDRAARRGQKRVVIVKIPLVPKTIDEAFYGINTAKKRIAGEVFDSTAAEQAGAEERMLEEIRKAAAEGATNDILIPTEEAA